MKYQGICEQCGIAANVLTCLKKYKAPPQKLKFDTSTYSEGQCRICGMDKWVTEERDFFYPDFNLLLEKIQLPL